MRASDAARYRVNPIPSPWAYFWPVAVAVFAGVLAATFVIALIGAAVIRYEERQVQASLRQIERQQSAAARQLADGINRSLAGNPLPAYPAPSSADPIGSLGCSGGVIFRRLDNGWQQASRGNDPACVTSSR